MAELRHFVKEMGVVGWLTWAVCVAGCVAVFLLIMRDNGLCCHG